MRVVAAILLSVFLLAGTWAYTKFAESVRPEPVNVQAKLDEATWRIVVTRSFECVPDPENEAPAFSIRFKGTDVFTESERIDVNQELEFTDLPQVEQGANEVRVAATLARSDDYEIDLEQPRALQVQIFRGYVLIKDQTIWSEPGATTIEESVIFDAPIENTSPDHEH